jgi:DNA-binding GntR family transcriptional regulator
MVDGTLRPGDRIRQEMVAGALDLSLIPVREALRVLESEGQVTYRPRRGYAVTELDVGELGEIYELRRLLEGEAVRRALAQLGDDDLRRMRDAVTANARAAAAGDVGEALVTNRQFHFAIFEAAGSQHLVRLIRLLWESTETYRALYNNSPDARAAIEDEHGRILAALEARDAGAVIAELDRHRAHALESLGRILGG